MGCQVVDFCPRAVYSRRFLGSALFAKSALDEFRVDMLWPNPITIHVKFPGA
jgi:hypothetical protein